MNPIRTLALCTAALLAAVLGAAPAFGQAGFPSKVVKIIVPFPAGGSADVLARIVGEKLSAKWGQPVVVENRVGAGGNIGAEAVFRADPDGHTILSSPPGPLAINLNLYKQLAFDPTKFVPVTVLAIVPNVITARLDLPANSVKELIAYAKANPGKISFGSSGIGAAAHLTTEWLKQIASVDMVHVPYKGTAPALQDLMSGNIQILVDTPSSLMPHIKGGKIKALGMFSAQRLASAPEVPTLAEAGGPPMESSTWLLFLAPVGTPRDLVTRLSTEVAKAVNAADVKPKLEGMGIITVGSTPEAAGKFLNDEIAKWAKVIQVAGVKAEQ